MIVEQALENIKQGMEPVMGFEEKVNGEYFLLTITLRKHYDDMEFYRLIFDVQCKQCGEINTKEFWCSSIDKQIIEMERVFDIEKRIRWKGSCIECNTNELLFFSTDVIKFWQKYRQEYKRFDNYYKI